MTKIMMAALAFGAALICGAPSARAQSTTLTLGTVNAVGTMVNRMGNLLRDEIAKTNTGLRINHVEGEVLGNAPQVMDQVSKGSLHIMGNDLAWVAPFHKDLGILNWSFAFRDIDHFGRYLNSPAFEEITADIAKRTGVRVIAAAPGQKRYMYLRTPIRSPDELKGMKIRVPQIKTFVESWRSFGVAPTPLNFGEVFIAIKTGVIDGAFGAPSDTFGNNFHLAGNNIYRLADTFSSYMVVVNDPAFQRLTPEQKAVLVEKSKQAVNWASNEAAAEEEDLSKKMEQTGAKFSPLDTAPLRAAALARGEKMEAEGEWSQGLLKRLQEIR